MNTESLLHKLNPAVPNRWLFVLAGAVWTAVGLVLCLRALTWLAAEPEPAATLWAVSGVAVAVAGNRFMFAAVARRNVGRIAALPQRACIFAFTAWKGYIMIALMITLGMLLRNSSMPKHYIAPLYLAMGGALLLASSVFYQSFRNHGHH